jgi:hypothetical protein
VKLFRALAEGRQKLAEAETAAEPEAAAKPRP